MPKLYSSNNNLLAFSSLWQLVNSHMTIATVGWPETRFSLYLQSQLVSSTPVKCLTVAQAAAEHEQLVGQLQVKSLLTFACLPKGHTTPSSQIPGLAIQ